MIDFKEFMSSPLGTRQTPMVQVMWTRQTADNKGILKFLINRSIAEPNANKRYFPRKLRGFPANRVHGVFPLNVRPCCQRERPSTSQRFYGVCNGLFSKIAHSTAYGWSAL